MAAGVGAAWSRAGVPNDPGGLEAGLPRAATHRMTGASRARGGAAAQMTPSAPSRLRGARRGAALLVLSLLAAFAPLADARGAAARSASSASGGASSTATGAQVVGALAAVHDTSPAATTAKNSVVAKVSPVLQNVSLRCAGAHAPSTQRATCTRGCARPRGRARGRRRG